MDGRTVNNTISLLDEFDRLKNLKDGIIDLTRPMDGSLQVYSMPDYTDPAFKINTWSTISERGFAVSQVIMGTQTGTHIDAPAHFLESGAKMSSLTANELMGRFFLIDTGDSGFDESIISKYNSEPFLFIKSCKEKAMLPRDFFERLLSLNARIWVVAGECGIAAEESFSFNRGLALAGKFLVEDLDPSMADKITSNGYIIAMPLKLMETGGAPCRVVVVRGV